MHMHMHMQAYTREHAPTCAPACMPANASGKAGQIPAFQCQPVAPVPPPYQALRVSLGNLGVITRAKLRIIREVPVRRELTKLTPPAFLEMMQQLQEAALAGGEEDPAKLPPWARETEWFWIPQVCMALMMMVVMMEPKALLAWLGGGSLVLMLASILVWGSLYIWV